MPAVYEINLGRFYHEIESCKNFFEEVKIFFFMLLLHLRKQITFAVSCAISAICLLGYGLAYHLARGYFLSMSFPVDK